MKRILPLLLAISAAMTGIAQKGIKTEVDKNTGDTLFSTKEKTLYIKSGAKNSVADYLKSTIYKSKNGFMLCFSVQTGRTSVFSISKNSTADLTLEDGSVVSLPTISGSQSKVSRLDYGAYLFVYYRINNSHLQKLRNHKIRSVTIYSSTGNMDYELKEKASAIIADQLSLFQ